MLRPLMFVLALAVLLPATSLSWDSDEFTPQVPCTDPRGCPDLVTDTVKLILGTQRTENFGENSCDVVEGMVQAGARQVLRFTFSSPNLGDGDLRIGAPAAHPEWFEFHDCHNHYHFREYSDYRLWTVEGFLAWNDLRNANPDLEPSEVLAQHPELLDDFVAGAKRGFCVIDIAVDVSLPTGTPVVPDFPPKYGNCNNNQGISRGWADEYIFTLSGQYVDVTDVPTGLYILEAEVNPERLYREMSYSNNRAWLPVPVVEAL